MTAEVDRGDGGAPVASPIVADPVLFVLLAIGLAATAGLAVLTHAPNRIVSGQSIALVEVLTGWRRLLLVPVAAIGIAVFRRPSPRGRIVTAFAAVVFAAGLVAIAGAEATARADPALPAARTAFGGAFWLDYAIAWLILADAVKRAGLATPWRLVAGLAFFAPTAVLLAAGALDDVSLLREYANRHDVFAAALGRHVVIVAVTSAASLAIAVPLGIAAFRRPAWGAPLFALLGIVQTIPSIALFGLLMGPLAALAGAAPVLARLGLAGIGLAPAVVALTLYSLLPIARSVVAGLGRTPAATLEAARGLGFGPARIFWTVELPLATPVLLSGLRVSLVQTIGIAVVAALIGAGGLGAIVFQGLSGSALDLVLLGVVPVVAMAAVVDAVFRFAVTLLEARTA